MQGRAYVWQSGFNKDLVLPYNLRREDFAMAMDDIYVLLANVNESLIDRGLLRLEESVRGAIYSGMLSDLMTAALAKHALGLAKNSFKNGHPDLLPIGRYAHDAAQSAEEGVEVKVTNKPGGAVDMHGARPAWIAVFRYAVDLITEPVMDRAPTRFTDLWLVRVQAEDFRKNPRGELGTRTATLHREGLRKMRESWLYRVKGG